MSDGRRSLRNSSSHHSKSNKENTGNSRSNQTNHDGFPVRNGFVRTGNNASRSSLRSLNTNVITNSIQQVQIAEIDMASYRKETGKRSQYSESVIESQDSSQSSSYSADFKRPKCDSLESDSSFEIENENEGFQLDNSELYQEHNDATLAFHLDNSELYNLNDENVDSNTSSNAVVKTDDCENVEDSTPTLPTDAVNTMHVEPENPTSYLPFRTGMYTFYSVSNESSRSIRPSTISPRAIWCIEMPDLTVAKPMPTMEITDETDVPIHPLRPTNVDNWAFPYSDEYHQIMKASEIVDFARTTNYLDFHTDLSIEIRAKMVSSMMNILNNFINHYIIFSAVNIMDRYLSSLARPELRGMSISRNEIYTTAIACIMIAYKNDVCGRVGVDQILDLIPTVSPDSFKKKVVGTETYVLMGIDWKLMTPRIDTFLPRCLVRANLLETNDIVAKCLSERVLLEYRMLSYPPSLTSAAIAALVNNLEFQNIRNDEFSDDELQACMSEITLILSFETFSRAIKCAIKCELLTLEALNSIILTWFHVLYNPLLWRAKYCTGLIPDLEVFNSPPNFNTASLRDYFSTIFKFEFVRPLQKFLQCCPLQKLPSVARTGQEAFNRSNSYFCAPENGINVGVLIEPTTMVFPPASPSGFIKRVVAVPAKPVNSDSIQLVEQPLSIQPMITPITAMEDEVSIKMNSSTHAVQSVPRLTSNSSLSTVSSDSSNMRLPSAATNLNEVKLLLDRLSEELNYSTRIHEAVRRKYSLETYKKLVMVAPVTEYVPIEMEIK